MPCSATGIAGPATGGGPAIPVEFGGGARSSLQPVPAQHSRCLSVVLCELPLTDEKKVSRCENFSKLRVPSAVSYKHRCCFKQRNPRSADDVVTWTRKE